MRSAASDLSTQGGSGGFAVHQLAAPQCVAALVAAAAQRRRRRALVEAIGFQRLLEDRPFIGMHRGTEIIRLDAESRGCRDSVAGVVFCSWSTHGRRIRRNGWRAERPGRGEGIKLNGAD